MQSEAVFKITFGHWAVLFLMPIGHANHRARREHGSRFAQAANEYPPLLWVRGLIAIPLYAFLIDWLFSAHWLPWASVPLAGVGFGVVVVCLMWWTMLALGTNYRGTMGLHPNHKLVFPLISIVVFLMSANWVVGVAALIVTGTVSIVRTPIEEKQLIERFGAEYRAYMRRTGRFFPSLRRCGM